MSISPSEELMAALSELRTLFPNWRLGQLVANVTLAAGATDAGAIWNVEDEQLLVAARRLIAPNGVRGQVQAKRNASDLHGAFHPIGREEFQE